MADTGAVWTHERLRARHAATGRLYDEVLRVEALSAGIYTLAAGAADAQAPHREDEVYVVLAGTAAVEIEGNREPVSTGSLVYVPKGVQHRFVDITEDLEVLVVFAPPETT
ncbi:MAG: cupin domain-containing protein [Actinomycetota bacterium]|nr:cupin domain-containing protein [Actinomycetota bacterium]PLS74881.1 MAG: hypothetical protein CYG61_10345 [Actinomycetota bacterium]